MVRPIGQVEKGLKDAARGEGDLSKRLDIKTKDEVGTLAQWFNSFVEKLQGTIFNLAGNSARLAESSKELLGEISQKIFRISSSRFDEDIVVRKILKLQLVRQM